jgi:hypothetical protein
MDFMRIDNFGPGNTFVAFIDISGFKKLMKNDKKRAWKYLDLFYNEGYTSLMQQENTNLRVEGIFISDCGILFVRNESEERDNIKGLKMLLSIINNINKNLLRMDILLTTSIAYGEFEYRNKVELQGMIKNPLGGNAYLNAFEDTEAKPKINPGECRIVAKDLPEELLNLIKNRHGLSDDDPLSFLKRRNNGKTHYYYYWMAGENGQIKRIDKAYLLAEESKYVAIRKLLKGDYRWEECLKEPEKIGDNFNHG